MPADDIQEIRDALDAMVQVLPFPWEVLRIVLPEYSFEFNHFPGVIESNDRPPRAVNDDREVISIDESLGKYDPTTRTITLFLVGLKDASERLGCKTDHLHQIVTIHEWFHALTHLGVSATMRDSFWVDDKMRSRLLAENEAVYRGIPRELHEIIAQVGTALTIRSLAKSCGTDKARAVWARRIEVFEQLCVAQPREYKINDYAHLTQVEFRKGYILLRDKHLRSSVEAWAAYCKPIAT